MALEFIKNSRGGVICFVAGKIVVIDQVKINKPELGLSSLTQRTEKKQNWNKNFKNL